MYRSAAYVIMAFFTAFVGTSWAVRGFPIYPFHPVTEMQPNTNTTFGDTRETDEKRKRKEAIEKAERTSDPALDKLRLATLQAATAYSLSPCDPTMKANLIAALTAYTQAWQRILNCPGPRMLCGESNMLRATSTFSTSLDQRVKEALEKAFDQKGIATADFPRDIQFDMLQFTGFEQGSADSSACTRVTRKGGKIR